MWINTAQNRHSITSILFIGYVYVPDEAHCTIALPYIKYIERKILVVIPRLETLKIGLFKNLYGLSILSNISCNSIV